MTREPLPDGRPDCSCPECGAETQNLVGGSRCSECAWSERD